MKYPLTPEYLEGLPEYIVKLYQDLEDFIIKDICRRLKWSGEITNSAIDQINILRDQGIELEDIEQQIQRILKLSQQEYDELFDRAVERNKQYYDGVAEKADLTFSTFSVESRQREIDAIRRQTLDEFVNLTQSMGFAIRGAGGSVQFLPIAKAYQKILDDASMEVWSGAIDYNTAIRNAVRKLADSGLQTVDYASGWHNRVDVAARRAVMTGINQMSSQYSIQMMEELHTDLVEVTAHASARDKGVGFINHKSWQGKWYSFSGNNKKYPSLVEVCGWGDVAGLEGANCRHHFYPVVEGVDTPTYTKEYLDNIDPPPITYEGKQYSAYEATQKQRQMESSMRSLTRKEMAYREAGLTEDAQDISIRKRRLSAKYKEFSKAAGLREQRERMRVQHPDTKSGMEAMRLKIQRDAEFPIRNAIRSGEYPLTINPEKQAIHMDGTAKPGRSVITISMEELQKIIDDNAGSGKIVMTKDLKKWKDTEIVYAGREIGYTVNANGDIIITRSIKIHYSKTGTHAVPFSRRWKK